MGAGSFVQDSCLGGFWSEFAQGRVKDPDYSRALAECFNSFPLEEGAWVRRGGTQVAGHTRNGAAGRITEFEFTAGAPYNVELTDGHLRLWKGVRLVSNDSAAVLQISLDNPAVVTIGTSKTWQDDDQAYIEYGDDFSSNTAPYLANRQLKLDRLTDTTYALYDPVTGLPIDGNKVLWPLTGMTATIYRIADIATDYTAARIPDVRTVQSDMQILMLHGEVRPAALSATDGTPFASFLKTSPAFLDGPWMDPPTDGSTLDPSGVSGSITIVASSTASINGGQGFLASDVGRLVRLYSQPANWASGTTYAANAKVTYNGVAYYSVGGSNTGNQPDINPALWISRPTLASWSWAQITARTNSTTVTALIKGPNLPYSGATSIWQLGLYSDTTGWPTCGCFHEGRIWLAGAIPNRIDACKTNKFDATQINFAPTDSYGQVADDNAIAYVFNATESNKILWMQPSATGIICGTAGAEWLIQASSNNVVITPTNVQAHPSTAYKCANVEPVRTGVSAVFVQKAKRKLHEYIADAYSGKFYGPNLASKAKKLTQSGIAELAFHEEIAPTVWMRLENGMLAATTYRRSSLFSSQPPDFNAWHYHELGSGRLVESISAGPMSSVAGDIDTLAMVTNDTTGVRYFELLRKAQDEDDLLETQWHVDCGVVPSTGRIVSGNTTLRFFGLRALAGKTVACVVGGLDCGDHTVHQDGYVDVPFGEANGLLTYTYLAQLSISGKDFGDMLVSVDKGKLRIPVCIGFNYVSRGQALRPIAPEDTGAQRGPAFAKTKRASSFGVLLVNAVQVYFGTDFARTRKASFRSKGQRALPANEPFTGMFWNALEDEYSMDSQFAWEVRRPWPCGLAAFGLFENTEDRD